MTGLDFLTAIEKASLDLPIRIFTTGRNPNLYRPHAVSFCNLTLDDGDEIAPETFARLGGCDVSIVADEMSDEIRAIAKALIPVRPKHLAVCAGNTLASWAPARGWK